jgi:HK97 family phage major capsid protein
MKEQIKKLYDEANTLHVQAKAILTEFDGKEMPAEKAAEADRLLDQVEAKTAEAKRLERAVEQDAFLNDPVQGKAIFGATQPAPEIKVKWNGRTLDADEVKELQTAANFTAFLAAQSPEYGKAMRRYMRYGASDLTSDDRKALSAGEGAAGGYLQQDTYWSGLIVKAQEMSCMRRISNVLPPVPSGAVIAPAEDSVFSDAAWTTEIETGSADSVTPFGQRRLQPHPLAKRVLVSNTFMRTPTFDVEAYVRDRLGYKFGVTQEDAFLNGTGAQQPRGLLNTPSLPTFTTASSTQIYGNDLINWIYALPAAYLGKPKTRIVCNRAFIRKIRALATPVNGTTFTNYLWQPGLASGVPNTILDVPYELSDRLDDGLDTNDAWEANAVVAVVGDFSYYWIVDALQMSVQRLVELYAASNQTGFIGRMESDGQAVLAEAFYALKVKS